MSVSLSANAGITWEPVTLDGSGGVNLIEPAAGVTEYLVKVDLEGRGDRLSEPRSNTVLRRVVLGA